MSISDDITKKSKRESESSVSEPQPENTARAGRACDDDYPDRIVHHNERSARDRPADQPEPQTDPAPASDEGPDKQGRKKKEPKPEDTTPTKKLPRKRVRVTFLFAFTIMAGLLILCYFVQKYPKKRISTKGNKQQDSLLLTFSFAMEVS